MALAKITIIWLKPNIKLILKDGLKPIPIQICNKNREFYISSFKLPPDLSKTMFLLFFNLNCLQIYLEEKISICFKWALAKITIIWLKPNIKLILKDGLKPIPIQICNKNREFYISFFKLPPDLSGGKISILFIIHPSRFKTGHLVQKSHC